LTIPQVIRYLLWSGVAPKHYRWGLVGITDNYYHVNYQHPEPRLVLVISTAMWCKAEGLGKFLADSVTLEKEDVDKPVYFLINGCVLTPVTEALLSLEAAFIDPADSLMSALFPVTTSKE